MDRWNGSQRGFALITVMMLLALLMTMIVGYFTLTRIELSTTRSSMNSFRGLYSAEAGLNIRAADVREIFVGYNRPGGEGPDLAGATDACDPGNLGSGDYACRFHVFEDRNVQSFLAESPENPLSIVIPRGEQYQNLNAQEYGYTAYSESTALDGFTEAMLEMRFKSRLVPLFQFAAFYNKDLEILPGPAMTLAGPVHSNGDLYLGTNDTMQIDGQVTTAGELYHGRKNTDTCMVGPVGVADPGTITDIPDCNGTRLHLPQPALVSWNGMIRTGIDPVTVPAPEALDPVPGEIYWEKADIRIVLDLDEDNDGDYDADDTPAVVVRNIDGSDRLLDSNTLNACGVVDRSETFYNNREGTSIEMLDVDVRGLLDCIHVNDLLGPLSGIDETSEGGLVWYLGVDGPASNTLNNYGVRVHNGAQLASTDPLAPAIQGLTVVTNQAVYIQGNYNAVNKRPAAFLADSLNILSSAWDAPGSAAEQSASQEPDVDHPDRTAADTAINAAFLAGTDSTGGVEGTAGQDAGQYNGGLENYPRFHEKWSGKWLNYRGSFVSLNTPRHVDGAWIYGDPQYKAPKRNFGYDTAFDQAENLPPLSPRFTYLRQELFVRQFDL